MNAPFLLALSIAAALRVTGPSDLRPHQLRSLVAGMVAAAVGLGVA